MARPEIEFIAPSENISQVRDFRSEICWLWGIGLGEGWLGEASGLFCRGWLYEFGLGFFFFGNWYFLRVWGLDFWIFFDLGSHVGRVVGGRSWRGGLDD
jgi:hypothetical protein